MPPSTLLVVAPTTLLVLAAAFIFRARCQHQLQQNQGLLLNEPTSTCSAAGGCGGRDYETIVLQVVESFHLTRTELNSIVKSFIVSFKAGLASPGASISSSLNNISGSGSGSGAGFNDIIEPLPMLPSFVTNLPKGSERGAYLALDLGGTNFRVCLITLDGQHHVAVSQQKYRLPDEMKHGTTPEPLFDFFAQCLASFIDEYSDELDLARYTSSSGTRDRRLKLGFTFSFPLYQSGIAHGVLEYWNKGFNIDGVVGKDVAGLLQQALDRRNMKLTVKALCNDTVGTLVSHSYINPSTRVAVILGTGTNAAYVEKIGNMGKWQRQLGSPGKATIKSGEMVINTEWGAFDNKKNIIPRTQYDDLLDEASSVPCMQIFEKMVSGMYLGEIVRLALLDVFERTSRVNEIASLANKFKQAVGPYKFETAFMSRIESDETPSLEGVKALFESEFGIHLANAKDRLAVRKVCEAVGTRSALLAAAGTAALIIKMSRQMEETTVAIDGSLFEHYPRYADRMKNGIEEILGIFAENIHLEQASDGSGAGAALIAACAE